VTEKAAITIPDDVAGESQKDRNASLRRQLAEAEKNLRLLEEREAEYVLSTEVPLQLLKERRRLRERITHLKAQLKEGAESTKINRRKPYVMRQYENVDNMPELARKFELTIEMELEHNERNQRLLQYAIAGLLQISPNAVRIVSIERGSVKVTIELPAESAGWLWTAFKRNSIELHEYLAPLGLIDLRWNEMADFTSILERRVEYWVLAIAGGGGIGKTRLLEQMLAISQAYGTVHSGLIDFYYTDLQTETGLLNAIGSRVGFEHFPQLPQALERCGTGPAPVREEMLNIAVGHFVSGLRELAAGRTVVLFFDTFEKATETGVARWFLEKVLPQMRGSAVVVLAGRNTFRLADDGDEATGAEGYVPAIIPLSPEQVHLLSLASFSLSEVHHYLREYLIRRGVGDVPQRYADPEKPPPEVRIIWEKSEGHPVLVALAADWLAEWGTGALADIRELPHRQSKRALVLKVLDLETPEDQAVMRMAHVYYRFDAEILDAIYPELREKGFAPGQVIQNLSRLSFVKYWPETGNCVLHDEMQRLIERYVWDEIDPTAEVRREISAEVVKYYDQAITKESDERFRWSLEAERMYHRLYSNLEKGRAEFWHQMDEAWSTYRLDLMRMLLSKGEEVNTRLRDSLLSVLWRAARAWVDLDEWDLERARERAQSVLDDPACTQLTRATALAALGVYADRKGDGDLAIERCQEAVRLYRDLEKRLVQGKALPTEHGIPRLKGVRAEISVLLNFIGIAHRRKGLLDEAVVYYNQAREVARQEEDPEWLAASLNNIGNIERLRGNLPLARSLCEQALRYRKWLHREQPEVAYLHDVGLSYSTLGLILRDMAEYDQAQEQFEQAEEIFEELRFRLGLVWSARNLGWVSYLRGKSTDNENAQRKCFEEALSHYARSRQVCEEFRIELELPNLLNRIGIAQRALGDIEMAQQTFTRSLELARDYGDNPFIANNLVRLAEMVYATGDLKQVAAYADELCQFKGQGFHFGLAYAEMEELLAQIALDAGEYEEAFRHIGEDYTHLARLNRWRFNRKISVLREFFEALPDDERRRRCGEQLIRFWEEQGLMEEYADLTAICEEYIMGVM